MVKVGHVHKANHHIVVNKHVVVNKHAIMAAEKSHYKGHSF